jgi:hypothetical protein
MSFIVGHHRAVAGERGAVVIERGGCTGNLLIPYSH